MNALLKDISRLGGGHHIPFANRILRIPFSVDGVEIAAASQGTNLNKEKVEIAWRQALSTWSAVTPLEFQPPFAGEETMLRIHFVQNGQMSGARGTTSGSITNTPDGLIGSASIEIDCDNELFVDRFLEEDRFPVILGPFDLVAILTHEVGHALGLDHPPVDPNTGSETEAAIMSAGFPPKVVDRQLYPYDLREVQQRHRTLRMAEPVKALLEETSQLIDASPGIVLQRGSFGLVLFGPMQTRTLLDVLVPAKGRLVNSIRLKFTTITQNVIVNQVAAFEGIIPIQAFAVSARNRSHGGLAGKSWDMQLGFQRRRTMDNNMLVRMDILFTDREGDSSSFGVLQIEEVAVETLPQPPVIEQGFKSEG